ncbi:MAG: 4-aminobutyrate--2-oxoglutarate transaminase [Deltaproteobacteria bacterium]|jgi:4-aminobutyrate aminotransferase/(S)-3-amino-2-methylpropionate transaminase|nr:4-aminobutyrate--2-oxoglutarate transaminase [Deltaproteobacteria bacterium]
MTTEYNLKILEKLRNTYIAKGFASSTRCYVKKASGVKIFDIDNNEYIDFAGGIAVMNVGHSHPHVIAAMKKQLDNFIHTCFMVLPYEQVIHLAEKLCNLMPGDFDKSAIFLNSGAEAVENAIKISRYYTKRTGIIAFDNAFHGRTNMGMSLTSKIKPYKYGFEPFAAEVYRMPYAYCYRCPFKLSHPTCNTACADYLNEFFLTHVNPDQTAAIIVEPVQGEGGFISPPPEYFLKLKKICEKNGILFIADEIQTGIGRTGTMFAMEQWGVSADITTVAKSLAAGMPLSAVVGKKEIMDSVHAGGIGGTYGGNPLACSAALAVLEVFENENLLEKSYILGKKLNQSLKAFQTKYDVIGDVRGKGPMMAMELVKDRETKEPAPDKTKELVQFCYDRGLIILSCGTFGNVIRLLMPLVIGDKELDKGLSIIEEGLSIIN